MSYESTLLYVWIKSLTKIYCILKSYEKVSIEYFTEDNFIFQFFLSHFNLNSEDYRGDFSLNDKLSVLKLNLKRFLEGNGYNSVTLLNNVFKNYHLMDNKMKIWKMMFTVTFLEDLGLLCKKFTFFNERTFCEKSFTNTDNENSVLNYNQNIPKKLTIRSMIKSPILLKLSLKIANEILSDCEVSFTDLENIIQINFNEALNESRMEEIFNIEMINSPHEKVNNNEMNNSNNISFTNNKSEFIKDDLTNNNENQIFYGINNNLVTERSNISKDGFISKRNWLKNNFFLAKKGNFDDGRYNFTLNNTNRSNEKYLAPNRDLLSNYDNMEINLKRNINSMNFNAPVCEVQKCEKCEMVSTKLEDLEKSLENEKTLNNNLNLSLKKYEEENNNLIKYNNILVSEKNTLTNNLKNLERKINILSVVEKQLREKENENVNLVCKVDEQEELIQNLQEKIEKYEDKIQLLTEYKIQVKMMQNEMNKLKKEMEILYTKPKEIKAVERFSILNRTDNFLTSKTNYRSKSQSEAFNYIENLNIYNDNKAQELYDLKATLGQNKEIIDQLKMKLTECKSIISYKENQIRTLETEINSINHSNKKREKILKTTQSNLSDKTIELAKTYFVLKWTYILLSIIFICLMIFKSI